MSNHLAQATVAQLLGWAQDILDELANRASAPLEPPEPQPPWERQYETVERVATRPQPEPRETRPTRPEPRARKAIGAGEDGMGGGPNPLAAAPVVDREPARRPPGTVYATGATDPDLAAAFNRLPARQGQAVHQYTGTGQGGEADMEPR